MAVILVAVSCGGEAAVPTTSPPEPAVSDSGFPPAPSVPEGPLTTEVQTALDRVWADYPDFRSIDMEAIGSSGDARLAWLLTDVLRFIGVGEPADATRAALAELTGIEVLTATGWVAVVDHLIAWDTPAPPDYVGYKRRIYAATDERFAEFFTTDGDLDYRWITWGGVFIDDRPPNGDVPCQGCIPGIDDPQVTGASEGDWYPDDRPVLGVVIDGEARAYPRNIMEVHEMVNDTLGGRDFALPYCTLCGSGQLYFTDDLPGEFDRPFMRTSGLLSRSNKVMYDVVTGSVFDTFTGRAVTGPLWEAGVHLDQGTVITTTWGEWKAEYPNTTIVELELGVGRLYELEPLGGRDAGGPIFPVGDRDERLEAREAVVGVVRDDGTTVAFPAVAAEASLAAGEAAEMAGVALHLDGGGLRASVDGQAVPAHEAFWFAWSQFHPDTLLWEPEMSRQQG